ncbi:formate dehydrogenase subunit delta [Sphingorhabdus sp.]|uniref:formate dehydrogenase subunit delta n=1 Tax=Sphingorhabdus sp. TaxID=1902408 RepID=UPI0037C9A9E5
MANQIAANLEREPDTATAVANHIKRYWDPRMKSLVRQPNVEGLSPAASAAIKMLTD